MKRRRIEVNLVQRFFSCLGYNIRFHLMYIYIFLKVVRLAYHSCCRKLRYSSYDKYDGVRKEMVKLAIGSNDILYPPSIRMFMKPQQLLRNIQFIIA